MCDSSAVADREYVGRLAPSPTGPIHQGTARTSLAAWLDCRSRGGRLLLRIEDVDGPRCVPGADDRIQRDLDWLGLGWDGPVTWQSQRTHLYWDAVERLERQGRVFRCACSRREAGPGPYPGTCRDRDPAELQGLRTALRFRTEPGDAVQVVDRRFGLQAEDVHRAVGDFVIRRSDGLWAYQLAVVVDDLEQGVTQVVRGSDLLDSTPRQVLLRRTLGGGEDLSWLHVPLLLGPGGTKLSKRDGAVAVASYRDRGERPEQVIGRLAATLGLVPFGTEISADELLPLWDVNALARDDAIIEG